MPKQNPTREDGFIMPVLLMTILFIMITLTYVASFALNTHSLAARETFKVNAQLAADAGLDKGINDLNINPQWTGSGGEVTLLNTPHLRTTYETILLPGANQDHVILSVIARAYSPSTATTPRVVRQYAIDLQAVTSGTNPAAVVTGVGGLILRNNARITGGDVLVNGFINIGNNGQIGTTTNTVNVRVAHQICPQPPNASYPQVCGPGSGQPITIGNNGVIHGTVHANNQTNGSRMHNPGLIPGQTVTPTALPEYNRAAHPVAVTRNATDPDIRCANNATRTWPANVKIIGDIDMANNCRITITGHVWITGNLNTGNNGQIIVSNHLGTNRPIIMIDGATGFVFGNNGRITPNSSGTGVELRTFWSHATSGCSPNCTNLTGPGLANSQNVVTIDLQNNGNASGSVFIAQWSRVRVSNNGALGAVAGQSIELGNNAVINFTASVPGSDNLTRTWVKRGYMRVFN